MLLSVHIVQRQIASWRFLNMYKLCPIILISVLALVYLALEPELPCWEKAFSLELYYSGTHAKHCSEKFQILMLNTVVKIFLTNLHNFSEFLYKFQNFYIILEVFWKFFRFFVRIGTFQKLLRKSTSFLENSYTSSSCMWILKYSKISHLIISEENL